MNTKRGRPKGPDKVVFKRRLTSDQIETLELIWPKLMEGGLTRDEAETLMATPMVVCKDVETAIVKTVNIPPSKEAHDAVQYLTEISQLKAQNMACLDNVVELEDKIKKLEARLERCSRATDDEKCLRWIQKYDELRAAIGPKGEYDQT